MIRMELIGNIGKDAEQTSREGWKNDVLNFSVAVTVGFGESQKTVWVNVAKWVKKDSSLCQHLKKGVKVFVAGEPSARGYQNRNTGDVNANLELNAFELILLSAKE